MLKLKLAWELETGERFEDWTIPVELSLAEKELYAGKSVIKILTEESDVLSDSSRAAIEHIIEAKFPLTDGRSNVPQMPERLRKLIDMVLEGPEH